MGCGPRGLIDAEPIGTDRNVNREVENFQSATLCEMPRRVRKSRRRDNPRQPVEGGAKMHRASLLGVTGTLALALGCGGGAASETRVAGVSGMTGVAGQDDIAGAGGTPSAAGGSAAGAPSVAGANNGAAGAPVHVVTDCAAPGAVDAWENITPPALNASKNGVLSVIVDPITSGTLYLGTEKGGMWRSVDCGANWVKTNTGRGASVLDSGSLWIILPDPGTPNALYAGSLYGSDPSLLRSSNGGADWDSLFPAGSNVAKAVSYNFFQDAGIDVTNPKHVVASFHADCAGDVGPMCLAESTDNGSTWRLFKGPTKAWGERAGVLVFGEKSFMYHTYIDGAFFTNDGGVTWDRFADGANFQTYQAADKSYYLGSLYGMLHSADGKAWEKIPGTPTGDALAGDGTRIFTVWGDSNPQFRYAMESDPTVWMPWAVPDSFTTRVGSLAYDSDHHILYSANTTGGLWRVVTKTGDTQPAN